MCLGIYVVWWFRVFWVLHVIWRTQKCLGLNRMKWHCIRVILWQWVLATLVIQHWKRVLCVVIDYNNLNGDTIVARRDVSLEEDMMRVSKVLYFRVKVTVGKRCKKRKMFWGFNNLKLRNNIHRCVNPNRELTRYKLSSHGAGSEIWILKLFFTFLKSNPSYLCKK